MYEKERNRFMSVASSEDLKRVETGRNAGKVAVGEAAPGYGGAGFRNLR